MAKYKDWSQLFNRLNNADDSANKVKRHQNDLEHRIQVSCVNWFDWTHRDISKSLLSFANGGKRDAVTGAKLKAEGVRAGAPDLILLLPRGKYHALAIEMKTPKGRQSPAQKEWQAYFESMGGKYVVCRSLEEFIEAIESYLNEERG